MSANVNSDGAVRQLDKRPEPDENITEKAVSEPKNLARFLLRLFRDVAALKRRWAPRRVDFVKAVAGTGASPETVILNHGLAGPVVWWVAKVTNASTQASALGNAIIPLTVETSASTEDMLFLQVYYTATLTIRVEESGG